jgi:LacI family transcriptional regulator, repressor for deo operon, udp, cdd, tsx, nupC, and nupG
MTSIKDVAKLAGVSVMTVSRALNNNYPVSQKTRALVMKAVKELDYEPNIMGRNLRNTSNKTVLVAGLGFVDAMLDGIYRAANELGYEVLLMHTRHFAKNDYIRRIKNGMSSGILFMNMPDEEVIAEIGAAYKVVQCGSAANMASGCSVSINEEEAAYELTDRFVRQGRPRVALVTASIGGTTLQMSKSRKSGYLRALADNGVQADPRLLYACEFIRENMLPAEAIAGQIAALDPAERPQAVICEQNVLSVACISLFRERGIAVPGEIAVASLDDQPVNLIIKPSITAIHRPYEAMGREAMQLLAAMIENKLTANRQIVFKHELARRESTDF